jgi:tetratricopeptide (TPR) repeat protein
VIFVDEESWALNCDLACAAAGRGDLENAADYWRIAWHQVASLERLDPRYLMTLEYFSDLLCLGQNYEEAEPLLVLLLELKSMAHGEMNAKVAATHNALAGLYFATRVLDKAELHCRKALEINETSFGENEDVVMILQNLAMLKHAQQLYADAEPLYKRALEIAGRVLGADNPTAGSIAEHYAAMLSATGRKEEAKNTTKTMVLPVYERLVRMVAETGAEAEKPAITNKGFAGSTLTGIQRDPRRSNQCMYRITPLPPPPTSKADEADELLKGS